jgi:hypothetical protein
MPLGKVVREEAYHILRQWKRLRSKEDGEIINIMVIAHYRQSTVTVAKMINRFIEHHMP